MYHVEFLEFYSNLMRESRIFETKRAAVRWAKWLASRPFTSLVQVWNQRGGILVHEIKR